MADVAYPHRERLLVMDDIAHCQAILSMNTYRQFISATEMSGTEWYSSLMSLKPLALEQDRPA